MTLVVNTMQSLFGSVTWYLFDVHKVGHASKEERWQSWSVRISTMSWL